MKSLALGFINILPLLDSSGSAIVPHTWLHISVAFTNKGLLVFLLHLTCPPGLKLWSLLSLPRAQANPAAVPAGHCRSQTKRNRDDPGTGSEGFCWGSQHFHSPFIGPRAVHKGNGVGTDDPVEGDPPQQTFGAVLAVTAPPISTILRMLHGSRTKIRS